MSMMMNTKSTTAIALAFVLTITFLAAAPAVFAVEPNDSTTGSWYVAANWGSSQPTKTRNVVFRNNAGRLDDASQLAVRSRRRGNLNFKVNGADATRTDVAATATSGSTSAPSASFDASGMGTLKTGTFTPKAGADLFIDVTEYAEALDSFRLAETSDLTAKYDLGNATVNHAGFGDNLIRNQSGGFRDFQFYRTPEAFLFVTMLAGLAGLWFCGRRRKRVRARVRVRAMY